MSPVDLLNAINVFSLIGIRSGWYSFVELNVAPFQTLLPRWKTTTLPLKSKLTWLTVPSFLVEFGHSFCSKCAVRRLSMKIVERYRINHWVVLVGTKIRANNTNLMAAKCAAPLTCVQLFYFFFHINGLRLWYIAPLLKISFIQQFRIKPGQIFLICWQISNGKFICWIVGLQENDQQSELEAIDVHMASIGKQRFRLTH